MNKTIESIFIILMLILPMFSITGLEENQPNSKISSNKSYHVTLDISSKRWLKSADQIMMNNVYSGFIQVDGSEYAQSFKPTKPILTAVALYYFKSGHPHENTKIFVSIREELNGCDLTTIEIEADDWNIKYNPRGSWVLFDFPDINVIPGNTYYIYEKVSHGTPFSDNYVWYVGLQNQYQNGNGWLRGDDELNYFDWMTLWEWMEYDEYYPDPDFCFITYHQKPKCRMVNLPFQLFFEKHPTLFQFLWNGIFSKS